MLSQEEKHVHSLRLKVTYFRCHTINGSTDSISEGAQLVQVQKISLQVEKGWDKVVSLSRRWSRFSSKGDSINSVIISSKIHSRPSQLPLCQLTAQTDYCITLNYGFSCINTWSCFVAGVKCTVTKLNVQYSALHTISCHQNSPPASQVINSMWLYY